MQRLDYLASLDALHRYLRHFISSASELRQVRSADEAGCSYIEAGLPSNHPLSRD
jgi:hypothetical protein